jgi:UDP-N-acetylglucosamine 2-epimerase (non-hydrolysing)
MKKVLVVMGTRPEAVKLAPVVRALERSSWFTPVVVSTGQHRAMLDQVLELFGIEPAHDLNIIQPGQTVSEVTRRALEGIGTVLDGERPDAVIVQGDTTTTFAGALAAFYAQIPAVHVEAGLRTYDRYSPYPEEINRRLTTQLCELHLAPTSGSARNLYVEHVPSSAVVVTGNTVIDALLWAVAQHTPFDDPVVTAVDAGDRDVLLVTAHRRESWHGGLARIAKALQRIATARPDVSVIFPIHRNPVVRNEITPLIAGCENVHIVEPLDYAQFAQLIARAKVVLTDSGGIQEEAPSLGKPVLVLRDTTERPEAIEAGTARLVGTDPDEIVAATLELFEDPVAYASMANAVNPYGDGQAARRTHDALGWLFGLCARPDPFAPLDAAGDVAQAS